MLQILSAIEVKYNRTKKIKQVFVNFTMPMLILAMRVEIEIIFKNNYRYFLGKRGISGHNEQGLKDIQDNLQRILRLINGVITEIFDPNLFYSRLNFLESGKEAIDIKTLLK